MTKEKEDTFPLDVDNIEEVVDDLTLFDDNLMSRVFDNNVEATELLLRIILNKKVKVISVVGQDEMKNHDVNGRNITLDIHAIDEEGKEIEIQRICIIKN